MNYEEIAPRFMELLDRAYDGGMTENFAARLAIGGANGSSLWSAAKEWEDADYEPSSFADELRDFAEELEQAGA